MDVRVLYHVIVLVSALHPGLATCLFPEYMQSDGNGRDWRGQVRSQFREFDLIITVRDSKMVVTSSKSRDTSYERICLQALSGDRYITAHEQARQREQRYACVQFLRRSHSIVQLKVSEVSGSMFGICDESELRLDPWLLVDKNSVLSQAELCTLTGGYSVKLYDKEYNRAMCDAYKDHVWLESECVPGSGLYFNFRYTRCIPNVLMSAQQRVVCVANWTDSGYTYNVIRDDGQRHLWVFRYPADWRHLASFVAHLMRDAYASARAHVTELDTYVRMDMVRDTAHPVTSLCVDEFEGCSYYADPCAGGGVTALTCARTCDLCNATRPLLCRFDARWQGDWLDASHGERLAVTVQPQTLTTYYNRLQQTFHCVTWDDPRPAGLPDGGGGGGRHVTHRMLVTGYENGCRPKYSCVRLVHRNGSPILFIQLSSERHWPFTSVVGEPVNCEHFRFDGDPDTLIPNRYRAKHYRMLYSKALDTGAVCNMPPVAGEAADANSRNNYTVILSDKSRCSAVLTAFASGSAVAVELRGCDPDSGAWRGVPAEHACIESSRLFGGDHVTVTRTDREPYQLYCWIFPRRRVGQAAGEFYLVKASHCNVNTRRRIARGHLVPLATFRAGHPADPPGHVTPLLTEASRGGYVVPLEDGPPGTGDSMADMTSDMASGDSESVGGDDGRDGVDHTVNLTRDVVGQNSTTRPPANPATYASPVVVVAAIIFFVVFQIPCLCKNS